VSDPDEIVGPSESNGPDFPSLTQLESDILALSATGLTTVEAALRLGQPPHVARLAIASAIRKLGARSKLEALLIAIRTGLITLPRFEE
jgi:DNA-binding CsgD family transcriptional regulator